MIRPTTPIERTARRKLWLFTWKRWITSRNGGGIAASPLSLLFVSLAAISRSFVTVYQQHEQQLEQQNESVHPWSSIMMNDLFIVLIALVCYFLFCYYERNKEQPKTATTSGRYIPLLFNEAVLLRHFMSPGLESRFTCSSPVDLPAVLQHLRQRVSLITETNPWLCGYLKTYYGVPSIWVPEDNNGNNKVPDISRLFHEIRVDDPDEMEQMLMQQTAVDVGANLLNTPQPFVKICVVYCPTSRDYYVTVCVTHMVGEPHLLYQLWGMLAADAPIVVLQPERIHSYKNHPLTALKGAARRKFLYYICWSQANVFRTLLLGHRHSDKSPRPFMHRRIVNMEWIQAQKDAYQQKHDDEDKPAFLSTQDVLTTWFFPQMKPACVCVAYSLHDRVKHVTLQHMGNYLEALVLFPDEYSNVGHVRRAIASAGEWAPPNNSPGANDHSVGLVTGWHTRYVDLELPGSVRQTHLPLRGAMFTGMIPRIMPCMCLFRTSRDQYAVLTLSKEELVDTSALGCPVTV